MFVVLVFFVVKLRKLVPAELNGVLEALQAVEDGALVGASVTVTGIAEGLELPVVRSESLPNNLSRLF